MNKLYFRYGTMNSSKTMNLLSVAHNYKEQGKHVIVIKPQIDTRYESKIVRSRAGIEREADIIIGPVDSIIEAVKGNKRIDCILVDECNFLSSNQVDELRLLTVKSPVICYGLRTSYDTKLFPGSKRLMELADSIEEIKTICVFCSKKSIINLKYRGNNIIKGGDSVIDIGGEDKYMSSCWHCWYTKQQL